MADSEEAASVLIEEDPQNASLRLRKSRGTPSILHVCVEARAAGLRVYRLLFGVFGAPVYFNPDRDTLDISCSIPVFRTWVALNPAIDPDLAQIQNLRLFTQANLTWNNPFSPLYLFPALRVLHHGERPQVLQPQSADLVRRVRLNAWPGRLAREWTQAFGAQAGPPPTLVLFTDQQVQFMFQSLWA